MKARFKRGIGVSIVITGLKDIESGTDGYIYDNSVDHGCKKFSTNELMEIVRQIEMEEWRGVAPQDIPPKYRETLNKVKEVIRKRADECFAPTHTHYPHCCCHQRRHPHSCCPHYC